MATLFPSLMSVTKVGRYTSLSDSEIRRVSHSLGAERRNPQAHSPVFYREQRRSLTTGLFRPAIRGMISKPGFNHRYRRVIHKIHPAVISFCRRSREDIDRRTASAKKGVSWTINMKWRSFTGLNVQSVFATAVPLRVT
jgi:hypothetical protein